MIFWFKKHFIPHIENNHRPHFLRAENARAILLLVVALELLVFVLPMLTFVSRVNHNTNIASVMPGVLAILTNEERKINNLPELVVSPLLTKAAELKAQDMAEKGYFAHTSPEGKTPWYWLNIVGYTYDYAGENLAINFSDSKDVTEAWMNSATHRANIVKSTYHEVGTGIATGVYQGRKTVFVAQVYANPRSAKEEREEQKEERAGSTALATAKNDQSNNTQLAVAETPNSVVLGEETNISSEVEEVEPTVSTTSFSSKNIDLNLQNPISNPTSFEKIASSPRHAISLALFAILGIVMLAVVLNIAIKTNLQHPDLITNGLAVTAVIVGILFANNYIGKKDILISQGFDYSHTQVANVGQAIELIQ